MGGASPTESQLRTSINMAISALGNKLHVPYYVPISFVSGTAAYDLRDLYVGRNAQPQVIRYATGSYESMAWWQIADNYLRVDPSTSGSGRIICLTPAPLIPSTSYTLAEHVDDGAEEIWLNGRIDGLPIAGWMAMGSDVWFYRGWSHNNAPERRFVALEAAAEGGAEVDPDEVFPVYDMPTGTYTKLHNAMRWPYNLVGEVHDPADIVQPCLAYTDEVVLDALVTRSAINAYRAKIHICAAPEDKALYSSMMANAQAEYDKVYRRVQPARMGRRVWKNSFSPGLSTLPVLDA